MKALVEYLGDDLARTKSIIRESLESDVDLVNMVNVTITAHPGKMLRPAVTLLMARALNRDGAFAPDTAFAYAAAIEMLHNATLLHDDVVDKSSTRRGSPTVSSLLGPSSAVLVGDFWIARAIRPILNLVGSVDDSLFRLICQTMDDLAGGEMLQLQKARMADTSEEDYYRIIYCKTASMFRAASLSAAYSVNATPTQAKAAEDYGVALGMAFQIKDDILDYGGGEELGKPVGGDLKEHKITLPFLGAVGGSKSERRMRRKVAGISNKGKDSDAVRDFVISHGGIDYAGSVLEEYVRKAVKALEILPDSREKSFLEEIARYNSVRVK